MTDTGYTVAALSAYLEQLRSAPGHTSKSISTIRSGARVILRELKQPADLAWNLDTVEDWCDAYANTDHAAELPPSTIAAYQHRLRRAARLFDTAQQPSDPQAGDRPAWLDDLEPTPRTLHDLRLLAAAWRTSPADAVARLIRFYLTFNPDQTPPNLPNDVEVIGFYKGTTITGVYHCRSGNLTVTSPPLPGKRFTTSSAAATATVAALNPHVGAANRTGYDFWIIAKTGQKLRAIRHR